MLKEKCLKAVKKKILAILDTTTSHGKVDCQRNSKWLLIQSFCAFREHQSSPSVSRTGAAASKMAANGCAVATMLLFLILLWPLCSQGSLSYPSHLQLKILFFLSYLTCSCVIETWSLGESEPHTFDPRSPEAVSVWGMKAESQICQREKVFIFPFVSGIPPPFSGQLCLFCSSPDFGNHLLQVLLSQLLRMI